MDGAIVAVRSGRGAPGHAAGKVIDPGGAGTSSSISDGALGLLY